MLKPSSEKWSQIRVRGKRAYIFSETLRFALTLGIVFSIPEVLRQESNWLLGVFSTFAIAFVGGILFSFVMWAVNEHEYKHHGQE